MFFEKDIANKYLSQDNGAEINLIASNLTNFFKAIVDFVEKVCAFLGIDLFAKEEEADA